MPLASYAPVVLSALACLGIACAGCQRDGAAPTTQPAATATGPSTDTPPPGDTSRATTPERDRPGAPPAIGPHDAVRRTETFGPDGGPRIPSEPVQEAPR
jgi:hypothetical protein